jgi:hypothetical protein
MSEESAEQKQVTERIYPLRRNLNIDNLAPEFPKLVRACIRRGQHSDPISSVEEMIY